MFCPYCGSKTGDNSKFCQRCGAKISEEIAQVVNKAPINEQPIVETNVLNEQPSIPVEQPVEQPNNNVDQYVYAQPNDTPNAYAYNQQSFATPARAVKPPVVRSSDPVINAVKNFFASPLFIFATIFLSVALFLHLIDVLANKNGFISFIDSFLGLFTQNNALTQIRTSVYSILGYISSIDLLVAILFMVPGILIAVGLWMKLAAALNTKTPLMKDTGVTIIKIVTIIKLVWWSIIFAVIEAAFVLLFIRVSSLSSSLSSSYPDVYRFLVETGSLRIFIISLITTQVLFAIFAVLTIMYLIKTITSLNKVNHTINAAQAIDKISSFVAVMLFVRAFIRFIWFVVSLSFSGTLTIFSSLFAIAYLICAGILIFKYKSVMQTQIQSDISETPQPAFTTGVQDENPIQ